MKGFIIEPLPFNSYNDAPSASDIENSDSNDSQFKSLIEHSKNQILLFERNKRDNSDDILIKIYSKLGSGTVNLMELNLVASGVQRVFSSMYNNLFGKGNSKGPIPKSILDSSELILTNTSPGSFNLYIKRKENNPIIEAHDQNAINYLSDLLEGISEENDYTDIIDDFGIRTFTILKDWFDQLDREEVEFEYSDIHQNKAITLTKDKIKSAYKSLNDIKTKELTESFDITGELIAADSKKINCYNKTQ